MDPFSDLIGIQDKSDPKVVCNPFIAPLGIEALATQISDVHDMYVKDDKHAHT